MKRVFLVLAVLALASLAGEPTRASIAVAGESMCTCVSPKRPTCEVWWQTSAIFTGRVTKIDLVTEEADDGQTHVKRLVRLRVQERWRGLQGKRDVTIATGAGGGDCGFQFDQGQTYLIYANQSVQTGRYETGICSRTSLVAEAAADLAYLSGIATADKTVSLYGVVYRERQIRMAGQDPDRHLDPGGPLADVEISLTDPAGEVRTILSDADGWYEIDDLTTGRYEMTLAGENIDETARWRLRIPVAPACIWRNIIVRPSADLESGGP